MTNNMAYDIYDVFQLSRLLTLTTLLERALGLAHLNDVRVERSDEDGSDQLQVAVVAVRLNKLNEFPNT